MTKGDAKAAYALAPGDRIAIIAGSGRLPIDVAEGLSAQGRKPFVLMVEGEADPSSSLSSYDHISLPMEDTASGPKLLRKHGVTHLVFAGGISRRPNIRRIKPSLAMLSMLRRAIGALARGDDVLLRMLVGEFEAVGIKVVGAHEVVPDLLAAEGPLTKLRPSRRDRLDIAAALAGARAIGALDIGQGAIAIGGRVIALEGIEGTDGLLERTKTLRTHGRLAGRTGGVLVKCAKKQQELRADLPTIGPSTIVAAHAAGLAGVCVEAERSLILDQAGVMAHADALGLFVLGLPRDAE